MTAASKCYRSLAAACLAESSAMASLAAACLAAASLNVASESSEPGTVECLAAAWPDFDLASAKSLAAACLTTA